MAVAEAYTEAGIKVPKIIAADENASCCCRFWLYFVAERANRKQHGELVSTGFTDLPKPIKVTAQPGASSCI